MGDLNDRTCHVDDPVRGIGHTASALSRFVRQMNDTTRQMVDLSRKVIESPRPIVESRAK